jgi:hypothetical protein
VFSVHDVRQTLPLAEGRRTSNCLQRLELPCWAYPAKEGAGHFATQAESNSVSKVPPQLEQRPVRAGALGTVADRPHITQYRRTVVRAARRSAARCSGQLATRNIWFSGKNPPPSQPHSDRGTRTTLTPASAQSKGDYSSTV